MDKRNHLSLPPSGQDKASDPADPSAAGSSVVFCGDPAQVSAGFALALRLMGMDVPVQDASVPDPPKKGDDA